jgi:SpoIIAA-like
MIELLEGMPDGTLGFRATGKITRDDYTGVLVPALQQVVQTGGSLRTLYLIDTLDQMEPSALWEDAKTGFDLGVRHHSSWERTAVVTDQEWLARAAGLFAWMAPGEFKVFPVAELEQAKAWVGGA